MEKGFGAQEMSQGCFGMLPPRPGVLSPPPPFKVSLMTKSCCPHSTPLAPSLLPWHNTAKFLPGGDQPLSFSGSGFPSLQMLLHWGGNSLWGIGHFQICIDCSQQANLVSVRSGWLHATSALLPLSCASPPQRL